MTTENAVDTPNETRLRGRRRKQAMASGQAVGESAKGAVAPQRKTKNEDEGNFLTRPFISMFRYLREVQSEVAKVTWPSRVDVARLTRIVVITTVIVAIFLYIVGAIYGAYIGFGLENAIVLVISVVVALGVAAFAFNRLNSGKARL